MGVPACRRVGVLACTPTCRHGYGGVEVVGVQAGRYGGVETYRYGGMEIRRLGDLEVWRRVSVYAHV